MPHTRIDFPLDGLGHRDLGSSELWQRSLERSLYRREHADRGRRELSRRKRGAVAVSAAMLAAPVAPSLVAAKSSGGGGLSLIHI